MYEAGQIKMKPFLSYLPALEHEAIWYLVQAPRPTVRTGHIRERTVRFCVSYIVDFKC